MLATLLSIFSLVGCGGSGGSSAGSSGGGSSGGGSSLTVSVIGNGTVTSSPAGISCPGTCTFAFASGTSVTLTATASPSTASSTVHGTGTELYAWGGATCTGQSSSGACSLTFTSGTTAAATFTPKDSDVWWVAPTGSDSNNCRSLKTPCLTIHHMVASMVSGDTAYFADGTMSSESLGGNGGQYTKDIVDGTSSKYTRFLGYSRSIGLATAATVDGNYAKLPLYLWHNNYVEVGYLRFLHSVDSPCGVDGSSGSNANFNATNIWIHDSACAYAKPAGSGANVIGLIANHCSGCLFERNWAWGFGSRYGIALYAGINNVLRGNVARYDGAPDGQPKAGIVLYDEDNSIAENNISIDFDKGTDSTSDVHASLFTTSSVTTANYPYGLGTVAWYGNIAMNTGAAGDGGLYYDSHASITSGSGGATPATFTAINNIVAGVTGTNAGGLWISADNQATTHGGNHTFNLNHNTIWNSNSNGVRIDNYPYTAVTFSNTIVHGGTFTSAGCYNKQWTGTPIAANNIWFNCDNLLYTAMPGATNTNPNFSWLENVTSGPAFGTGTGGSNIGATVVNKYVNGSLTGNLLWPFQNESYIQADFCAGPDISNAATCEATNATSCTVYTRGHNTTGFCASGKSLTKYIWEQLGGTSPY